MKTLQHFCFVVLLLNVSCKSYTHVYPEKMNYVYINARNPISVSSNERIKKISINNGEVYKENDHFILISKTIGICDLTVFQRNAQTFHFKVLGLDSSKVLAMLGPKGHSVDQNNLPKYIYPVWDVDFEVKSKVKEFRIDVYGEGTHVTHKNIGQEFDSITLKAVQNAHSLDTLIFTDIILEFENGNEMILRPVKIVR